VIAFGRDSRSLGYLTPPSIPDGPDAGRPPGEGIRAIAAAEFAVTDGRGLVILQTEAEAVERETGVKIRVYGFDTGARGLPELIGDHRDHPERWQAKDLKGARPL
jgi:hypothetical protein